MKGELIVCYIWYVREHIMTLSYHLGRWWPSHQRLELQRW